MIEKDPWFDCADKIISPNDWNLKIYHTVNRLRSFLSPSYSVTLSLVYLVTQSFGHLVIFSTCETNTQH